MSGMSNVTDNMDKPQDYKGKVFVGKVVVNDDIKKFHRIKVEIPDMWDNYGQDQLPWCMPGALPGGSGPNETYQNIPETGSFVYVTFQDGDNHFPVYHGGVRDFQTVQGVLAVNYPHRVGWQLNSFTQQSGGTERKRTALGKLASKLGDAIHHFFIDRSTNEVEYKHPTLTRINIADNGSVSVDVRKKAHPGGGNISWDVDLNVAWKAGGNWTENVTGSYTGTYGGSWTESVTGSYSGSYGGSWNNGISGDYTTSAANATYNVGTFTVNGQLVVSGNADFGADVTIAGTLTCGALNTSGAITGPTIDDIYARLGALENP